MFTEVYKMNKVFGVFYSAEQYIIFLVNQPYQRRECIRLVLGLGNIRQNDISLATLRVRFSGAS